MLKERIINTFESELQRQNKMWDEGCTAKIELTEKEIEEFQNSEIANSEEYWWEFEDLENGNKLLIISI